MTGRNPNDFYEVGYAHALGKTVILLTSNSEDIPFDFKHYPHIIYGGRITGFKNELERRVRWHLENPEQTQDGGAERIIFSVAGSTINEDVELGFPVSQRQFSGRGYPLTIGIHNPEETPLDASATQFGVVLPQELPPSTKYGTVQLPDKRFFHDLGSVGQLLPSAWTSVSVDLDAEALLEHLRSGRVVPIELRLFTPAGSRAMKFRLKLGVNDS
jgi:hypothetical protein